MRLAFQERPDDLVVIFLISAILAPFAILGAPGSPRVALGLVFVLFAPGYVLAVALFPKNADLSWIERLTLAAAMSMSVVILIGLGLNFTPGGISTEPLFVSLLVLTYAVGLVAWRRRSKLPIQERIAFSVTFKIPNGTSYSRADKIATVGLAASLVFAAGTVAYVVITPRPAEPFTEFYMVSVKGVAGGYPANLTVNETATVNLTVHNVEYADVAYEIRVYRATMERFFNASANLTQYRELSRTYVTNLSMGVPNGGYWNQSYSFSISTTGTYRLIFYLYKLPDTLNVYRHLFLTVNVRT